MVVKAGPSNVSRTVRDGSTPDDTCIAVRSPQEKSPVLIGNTNVSPVCGLIGSLQVGNKLQSTSLGKIRNDQKLDTSIDRKFPNDWDYASIFSKVIGREISHVSIEDLYLRFHMDFISNVVQTKVLQFVYLRILAFNTSDDFGILDTSATSIRRLTDGSHWYASDHVFGEASSFRITVSRSDQYYTWSIPRHPLCSHSLVCSEKHSFIVGIGPIRNKEL